MTPSSILFRKEKQPLPIDFEIGGVYLPPIAQALLLAIPIFMLLDWGLRRSCVLRLVSLEALF